MVLNKTINFRRWRILALLLWSGSLVLITYSLFLVEALSPLSLGRLSAAPALARPFTLLDLASPTPAASLYLPVILKPNLPALPMPTATATATATPITPVPTPAVLEPFEGTPASWQVGRDSQGSGSLEQSNLRAAAGNYSARAATSGSGSHARIRANFSDASGDHDWEERPGTWTWQWANVYLPSTTVAQLGADEYITLAGLWPSSGGPYGWGLNIRQGGELYVYGYDQAGAGREFRVYGTFPLDQWVDLELGLHSQDGPGVKRAFAFLINGDFYGWYRQGHMSGETYDRIAMGILDTNSNDALEVFIDQWHITTSDQVPGGPDHRSTAPVQEQDYRTRSGIQWQIDWSTWGNDLQLQAGHGLYSASSRLQSGRNLDRMPDLTSGWAEIEVDWSDGSPPSDLEPSSWFGPMVGFRKEINREQNLEVQFEPQGNGLIDLIYDAWTSSGPFVMGRWPVPLAAIGQGSHIPEPGDIVRVRWEQVSNTDLTVRVSYYDASAAVWYNDVINTTNNITSIPNSPAPIDFTDGYHQAASITIDSEDYSIRRFKVGILNICNC